MNLRARIGVGAAYIWLLLLGVAILVANFLPLPNPLDIDLTGALQSPSAAHLAGTDELGRDVFARVLFAARSTVLITAGATTVSIFLGALLGASAGLFGRWVDRFVLLTTDLFWSIPFVIFVVLIVSIIGVGKVSLIITIGAINWVSSARVVRAETLRLANADFIYAARSRGFTETRLLVSEIIPNLWRTIFTLAAYCAIEIMTLETGLAFLGLSIPAPAPTWGGLLAEGLSYFSSAWWVVLATAVAITATLGSLQVIAQRMESAS